MPEQPGVPARGGCLCGAVRFAARMPALWVAHCHCSRCRRAHGAAFVTWVGLRAEQAAIDDTGSALRWWRAETGAERGFCSRCGTPLFFRSPRYPGELHIARALFDDDLAQQPDSNDYFSAHVSWAPVAHDLPNDPEPG